MKIQAFKYQGAGNDFVIIDNRKVNLELSKEQIKLLCDRRFGIGGDGLMLLGSSKGHDFSMRYFNSDGGEGTMCGNGGRCLVAFAAHKGIKKYEFEAIDGLHNAKILDYSDKRCTVELGIIDVTDIKEYSPKSYFLNTGSPHLVIFVENLKDINVNEEGKLWRHHPHFPGGTNVNFVQGYWGRVSIPEYVDLSVRTYERGVEDETYACGTGVTASAIAFHKIVQKTNQTLGKDNPPIPETVRTKIQTLGDLLEVRFKYTGNDRYTDIKLIGPATFVFSCEIDV
ncbi:MAG: diaminopimelate epimerase [Bacteroidetes bacterium GWF2_40_14]|nr:MAG: diaminopimelate epimerase [Bacteroidetes bacterium GWF2_40_14]